MRRNIFENLYDNANIPVIVCEDDRDLSICFANAAAYILLNPALTVQDAAALDSMIPLRRLVRFADEDCFNKMSIRLKKTGALNKYPAALLSAENIVINVGLTANMTRHLGRSYAVIYIDAGSLFSSEEAAVNAAVLETASDSDAEDAIYSILSITGEYTDADRVFAFSSLPGSRIRNIYEWRSQDIPDAVKPLSARKCNYDALTGTPGLYVANDLSLIPESVQPDPSGHGVKAIAIFRLSHQHIPIGYIACETYKNFRIWRIRDLSLFLSISGILASLISRAGLDGGSRESRHIPVDSTESIIYVNDIDNYELKLAGNSLAALLDTQPEKLVNKPCWQSLKKNKGGPCPYCPIPALLELNICSGTPAPQNAAHDACVWIDDSLVLWIDGVITRFNLAIDISLRRHYDERLLHIASIDAMTGVLNRKWGTDLLNNEHKTARITGEPMSLCFIDLDHLKNINDAFGHKVGDEMILHVAESIRRRVRRDDIVCRWGGDEFLVLLKCDTDNADTVMSGIQNELCESTGIRPAMTFSYGIVDFAEFDCIDNAINAADHLMYADKNSKQRTR